MDLFHAFLLSNDLFQNQLFRKRFVCPDLGPYLLQSLWAYYISRQRVNDRSKLLKHENHEQGKKYLNQTDLWEQFD